MSPPPLLVFAFFFRIDIRHFTYNDFNAEALEAVVRQDVFCRLFPTFEKM
jgi:hypothetical protein